MKRLSNLLAALVFASLVIFMSCGGGGDDSGPSDLEIAVGNLTVSGGWNTLDDVFTDDGTADGDWSAFTISFTGNVNGGTYDVSGVPAGFEDVWADGTWTINSNGSTITRVQNGVTTEVGTSISESQVTFDFDVADPSARTSGIGGEWTFVMSNN